MQQYIKHLNAAGYLSLTSWVKVPPRDTLKLFATALVSLERVGAESPAKHLVLIRGWQTSTLLIKNGPITADEIEALKKFCRERSFDLGYYPGISAEEANRYNLLAEPYFYQGAQSLISNRADFLKRYKFNLTPATDDRPYFFHFLKTATIPEIIQLRDKGGVPLIEQSYVILVATLLQASTASVVLILLPLKFSKRLPQGHRAAHLKVFLYYFSIGLGFLFVEISFMQKFLVFLHHPLVAASLVVTSFLFFAGLGSATTKSLVPKYLPEEVLRWAVGLLIILGLGYLPMLDRLFAALMSQSLVVKIMITIVLIAPLGFCMGMPFPLALSRLSNSAPELIPWAWGVNGCASVVSAVLAMLLAINFGFTMVILTAMISYGVALLTFPSFSPKGNNCSSL